MYNTIPVVKPSMPPYDEYIEEIKDLWESRWLTHTGPKHQLLEKQLKDYLGVSYVELFANGHLALELAIKALNLSGEIITTPFTFASTTQAIVRNGLTPIFCDINEDDYTMDPDKIERLITNKTSAIIPVHVYGNVCDVKKIEKIADKYNLKVIYDAAHAFGIKIDNQDIGNFGDMSMFSFHATKVFHTVEGGGITFSNDEYKDRFSLLRQFGMKGQESVIEIGTNAKMTEMHAAMGLCNLRHIDENIRKRAAIVERYREKLSSIEGLKLTYEKPNVVSNYSYFPVYVEKHKYGKDRDELLSILAQYNIYGRKYFYPLTSEFDVYQGKFEINETPIAKRVANNILTLPLYPDLSINDVDRICEIIKNKR